jgi:predicted CXXCH cytochrome family protein
METPHMGKKVISDLRLAIGDSPTADRESQIEILKLSDDGRILCTTCHDIHQEPQSPKLLGTTVGELCGLCHQDKLGVRDSVHDPGANEWADELGFVSQGSCVDCHRIHGPARQGGIWEFMPSKDTQSQLCEICHQAAAPGKPVETPHVGKVLKTDTGVLPLSNNGQLLCTSCHDIHQKTPGAKLRASQRDSSLCVACHSEFVALLETRHDLRTSAPAVRNVRGETADESGPCGACHTVHRNSRSGGFWAQGSTSRRDFGRALCTCCHREERCGAEHIPMHTDHPDVPMLNRTQASQPDHMPTFDISGEPSAQGVISCLTCHEPHTAEAAQGLRTGPTENHNKFLRPAKNRQLCADCHGNEALWRFLYYHKSRRNPHAEREINPLSVDAKP